jgi:hypothetical protein
MKTFIRIVCLGLCLALAAPTAWAKTEDSEKKSSQQSKSKSKSDSKSKSKKSGSKSKKDKEPSKAKSKKGEAATASGGGFRDLPWGTPLSALKEPDLREQEGDLKYYTVPDDSMEVMGAHMREIVYVFCKDKLVGTLTRYDGQVNHLLVLTKLTETYGTPLESPQNVRGDRSWRFDVSDGTSIVMEYAENASTGALAWMAKDRLAACQAPGEQAQ